MMKMIWMNSTEKRLIKGKCKLMVEGNMKSKNLEEEICLMMMKIMIFLLII